MILKLIIQGTDSANSSRYITSDNPNNIIFATGGTMRVLVQDNIFRPTTYVRGQVDLGTNTERWKDLYLAGAASIGTSVTAGSYVKSTTYTEATTYLKTGSGVVNFKDKVNVQYNPTNECIEFIFS